MKKWIALYVDTTDVNKFVVASEDIGFSGINRLFREKYNKECYGVRSVLYSNGNAKYAKMIERISEIIDEEVSMMELINLIRQYSGQRNYIVPYVYNEFFDDIETITEAYHQKSKRNNNIEHMDRVFMTPEDEWDNESGKWEYDFVPEPMSYSDLMGWYDDFCLNYKEAFDTEDEHWTFIYDNKVFFNDEYTNIINQNGDKGKYYDGFEHRYVKRVEKNLPLEERFNSVPKRGLVAIIWSNGDEDRFWYKNNLGKELLVDYTGWSFEQLGDEWL